MQPVSVEVVPMRRVKYLMAGNGFSCYTYFIAPLISAGENVGRHLSAHTHPRHISS